MTKRGKLEIIKDILKVVKDSHNSIKITPLIRKSNLSTERFNGYYNELKEKAMIIEKKDEQNAKTISLTEKGFRYIEKYANIIGFIEEFDL
jgi:predicted transcriptional regulator